MSWWLNVSREQWPSAVSAQVERMQAAKVLYITAQDTRQGHRKFDSGAALAVRVRPEPEAA